MFRTKLVRAETQVLDAKAGVVQVAASDESEDRDGDVIRAAGWQLDHFQRHPVLLSSHNYMSLRSQIGEWEDVGVKNKRLVGVARYYVGEGNDEADWGFKLASRGRAAYSVGFIPLEYQERGEKGGYEFTKQELLEISHVTIPSNRNALQLMAGKGLLHPELDEIAREVLGEEETKDPEELDRSHRALADLHASLCTLGEACPAATKGIPHLVHAHVQAEVAVKGPIRSHDTAVVRRS
ncbi:MAG TPA: hypothetical protein VF184_00900, partial [Phycisphaeraceae bacterium]